jgi:hypothetical protein
MNVSCYALVKGYDLVRLSNTAIGLLSLLLLVMSQSRQKTVASPFTVSQVFSCHLFQFSEQNA